MFRFKKKNRFVIIATSIILFTVLILGITIQVNRKNIYPTQLEKKELNIFFNNRKINTIEDLIYIQNLAIDKIRHQFVSSKQLNSISTLKIKKGFCYDRSLILQKYCLINGYKIRPVYLFWGTNDTNIFDFFKIASVKTNSGACTASGNVSVAFKRPNFNAILSAAGCSNPKGPARFGPRRSCIQAATFLSA